MADTAVFPAFARIEYEPNPGAGTQMASDVRRILLDPKRILDEFGRDAKNMLDKALEIPRNNLGSLDLGVPQLREAARAQEDRARAAEEVYRATLRAAKAEGTYGQEVRHTIQATRVLWEEELKAAQAAHAHADGAEAIQRELNGQASATDRVTRATKGGQNAYQGLSKETTALKMATVGAGQQLQDIAISIYSGQRAGTVFAQQLPQLAFALSALEGSTNKTHARIGSFATFLSGPWGIAVGLAVGVLGTLVAKQFEGAGASDKLSSALDLQTSSYEELRKAVDKYNNSLRETEELNYQAIKTAKEKTEVLLREAEAELAKAQARYADAPTGASEGSTAIRSGLAAQLAAAEARIDKIRADLAADTAALVGKEVEAQLDKVVGITRKWDEEIRKVNLNYTKIIETTGKLSKAQEQAWEVEKARLEKKKKAEIDVYRESQKKTGSGSNPRGELTTFISPVTGGRVTSDPGIRRDPLHGKWASHSGIDIALPTGTRVGAPAGGMIIEAGYVKGYGNVVYIDHGAGTITRLAHLSQIAVKKGDIVAQGDKVGEVGSTGRSTGAHVHWETRVGDKVVDPRKQGMRLPTDPLDATRDGMEAAAKEMERLEGIGNKAAEAIARINDRFDESPKLIDMAMRATRELDKTIAELKDEEPEGFKKLIADAERAKAVIDEALVRPVADMRRGSIERMQLQELTLRGMEKEAAAVQAVISLEEKLGSEKVLQARLEAARAANQTEEVQRLERLLGIYPRLKKEVADIAAEEVQWNEAVRVREARMDRSVRSTKAQVDELNRAYATLESTIADLPNDARAALKGLVGSIRQQVNDIIAKRMTDRLFGDLFAGIEDQIRGKRPIDIATDKFVSNTANAGTALYELTNDFRYASSIFRGASVGDSGLSKIAGAPGVGSDAIPTGGRLFGKAAGAAWYSEDIIVRALGGKTENISDDLRKVEKAVKDGLKDGSPINQSLVKLIKGAAEGAFIGQAASSLILGGKGSGTGAGIGGAFGQVLGEKFLGKGLESIAKGLGSFAGPIGAIAGGLLGGVLGGLFKKTPKGYSVITSADEGGYSVSGNKAGVRADLTGASSSVQDGLRRIADQLDAELGGFSVSIGEYKGSYRVSASGSSSVGSKKYPKNAGSDLLYDGKDQAEAARVAILNAIQDGALKGLRAGTQRLLQAGKDLESAVQKALDFEGVFARYKQWKDPIGAAMDTVDKQFARTRKLFAEAGASAAELAQMEELYQHERTEAIKQANEALTGSLRSLLGDLTVGNSALSLRDRSALAQAAYDPLRARVEAGDTSAYDGFAEAARTLLGLEQEIYGSQPQYFALLDDVTALTRAALDAADTRADPSRSSAVPTVDNTLVAASIDNQTRAMLQAMGMQEAQLAALNENVIALARAWVASGGTQGALPAYIYQQPTGYW